MLVMFIGIVGKLRGVPSFFRIIFVAASTGRVSMLNSPRNSWSLFSFVPSGPNMSMRGGRVKGVPAA